MQRRIRADFDQRTIVVYQAYSPAIADAALAAGRFVPPFSFHRMTWIKPSFLWLMHRSNWGHKSGQERILAVRMTRAGWEKALSLAVLTSLEPGVLAGAADWPSEFDDAEVQVQWDPERSLRGAALPTTASRSASAAHIIREYVEEWVVGLTDITDTAHKIAALARTGRSAKVRQLLPPERPYPLDPAIARRIRADT